ncbi:uncharacterized protein LOC126852453 [Cataglyphis hispanica]|uniref:uncharacterized protein LOC126852453 n=1 Tax=Cataglyphis hispanica TaxID=1086592 RepID=UPI00217F291D|nr:uncharacterized protein LOC126852453 [Cataglyphis hispanica]
MRSSRITLVPGYGHTTRYSVRSKRCTIELGIVYEQQLASKFKLTGYSDSDFANDLTTRRSTTEYVITLVGGPITWSSHRQKIVTQNTTEAEYVAAAAAIVWLRYLLNDMEYHCVGPIKQ